MCLHFKQLKFEARNRMRRHLYTPIIVFHQIRCFLEMPYSDLQGHFKDFNDHSSDHSLLREMGTTWWIFAHSRNGIAITLYFKLFSLVLKETLCWGWGMAQQLEQASTALAEDLSLVLSTTSWNSHAPVNPASGNQGFQCPLLWSLQTHVRAHTTHTHTFGQPFPIPSQPTHFSIQVIAHLPSISSYFLH